MTALGHVLATNEGLARWCILHAYRGSIAYGMEPRPGSDRDTMAFCVPSIEHYFGLAEFGSRGTVELQHGEWDVVIYEARKALRLLLDGNANVLSTLWLEPEHYLAVEPAGQLLLDHRALFATRHVYRPFVGFATQQIYKMDHGAPEDQLGEKRRSLIQQHGYDTKNGAHAIRLLRMVIEFLRDGELRVRRDDAAELLAIRHGEWTLEQVKAQAQRLLVRAQEAHAESTLPIAPDRAAVDALCVEIVRTALESR